MNREEYTKELKKRLEGLDENDIADAIAYCEEYFNEAESEEAAIKELGAPAKFAAQLKAEAAIKEVNGDVTHKQPSSIKSLFWIIMGICALPIALPLALTAASLVLVFFILLFVFIMLAVVLFATCIYTAIASVISGFMNITAPADLITHIGFSLICIGVAGLCFLLSYTLIKKALPFFIERLSSFYHNHKGGIENEIV